MICSVWLLSASVPYASRRDGIEVRGLQDAEKKDTVQKIVFSYIPKCDILKQHQFAVLERKAAQTGQIEMRNNVQSRREWLKSLLLPTVTGLALFILTSRSGTGRHLGPDLLFSLASGYLLIGLIHLMTNLRALDAMVWGVGMLRQILVGKFRGGREETEAFHAYRNRTEIHRDAGWLLGISAGLMLCAVLWALLTA